MKTVGKIVKYVVILAIVGGLCYGGYTLYQKYYGDSASTSSASSGYTPVSVTSGDLTQEVISTGSLSIAETETVKSPADLTIKSVSVKAGQTVQKGDELAKVDVTTVDAALAALKTELDTLDTSLASLASSYSNSESITNTVEGRVKTIYGKVGDYVQDVIDQYAALYVLSLDGTMRVTVPGDGTWSVEDTVSVTYDTYKWTGTVTKVSGSDVTITFSDSVVLPGEEVRVLRNGVLIGTGTAQINMPLAVSSTVNGYISATNVKVNTLYSKRTKMYTVINVELTQEYEDSLTSREELIEQMDALRRMKSDPVIYADEAGIISSISASRDVAFLKDDALFELYVGEPSQMIVSVDELDIINVKIGQSATVVMDALTDKTYNATVEYISQIGTTSSGITSYSVTIKVQTDSDLKLGMNGTVTINLGETQNALLVPLTAIQSDSKGTYVWLYSASYQGTDEAPGIKTYITTGLSNENYAAVKSGLNVGDQVLVVRSAATSATSTTTGGDFSMFANMGGDMPSGGSMPTIPTGGSMPSGSGSGTGTRNNGGTGTRPGN